MMSRLRSAARRVIPATDSTAAVRDLYARYDALALELRDLNATTTNEYRAAIDALRDEVDHGLALVDGKREAFDQHVRIWLPESVAAAQAHLETRTDEAVDAATAGLRAQLRRLERRLATAPSSGATGATTADAATAAAPATAPPTTESDATEFGLSYSAFEDQLRGTPDHVKSLERVHVETIAGFGAEGLPVLDVGCGRGEMLELLADADIAARGIDLNEASAAECVEAGLDVVAGDAIEFLRSLGPGSLRAVIGLHIVEHLTDAQRMALFNAAFDALAPGGGLIVETPNPENLRVGATTFWLDPTHLRPVPPALLEFQVSTAGFDPVEIQRLHPSDDAIDVPAGADALTVDLAAVVNRLISGPMDYAVIGRRPADDTTSDSSDS